MRTIILALLAVFVLIPVSVFAQESDFRCKSNADCMSFEFCNEDGACEFPMADWRTGLELEVRGGLSLCVPMRSDCEGRTGKIKPGGGGGLFVGFRPIPKFSVGIDFGYYAFGHELSSNLPSEQVMEDGGYSNYDHTIRFLNIMAEIRSYMPFAYKCTGFGDLYFKLGVGYASFKEEYSFSLEGDPESDYPRVLHGPLNFKLGFGTTFYFLQDSQKGDVGVGINADYLIFFAKGDTVCTTGEGGVESCLEKESFRSRIHGMQLSAHFKWVLPIF